jgi:hypothetical protein
MFRDGDGLEFVNQCLMPHLVEVELLEGVQTCVGETICNVLLGAAETFYIQLSSTRYLWVDTDESGTVLYIEDSSFFRPLDGGDDWTPAISYWAGSKGEMA